ncbi:MAG: hypothetical protein F6J93_19060 [Oscillatoria sp. SIO1A7]|nr:hypothetical protein [Oscillatoria sp. SIO1A7]
MWEVWEVWEVRDEFNKIVLSPSPHTAPSPHPPHTLPFSASPILVIYFLFVRVRHDGLGALDNLSIVAQNTSLPRTLTEPKANKLKNS